MTDQTYNRQERLEKISKIVLQNREAGLDDLSESLGVSRMTIHRWIKRYDLG
mgnify:CR=1 FL=1